MSKRPEWVHCVLTGHADEPSMSWCGKKQWAFDKPFVDATHAALNGRGGGRLVACPECVEAIVTALRNGRPKASI